MNGHYPVAKRSPIDSVGIRTVNLTLDKNGKGRGMVMHQRTFRLEGFATDAPADVLLLAIYKGADNEKPAADYRGGVSLKYISDHPQVIGTGVTLQVGEILDLRFFGKPGTAFTFTVLGSEI